ncbi:MAG TPA: hypothetical protein VJ787_13025 [Thermoleophilia bacterium]|nr:hypothetical protein [Thermoleophilia bacterium]
MLWQPISEDVIKRSLREAKLAGRAAFRADIELVETYLDGPVDDVITSELHRRFPGAMDDSAQAIYPVSLPLVQRFIAEQATAYSHDVRRYFVDDDGSETDATRELSDQLQRGLGDGYDELMHRHEQLMIALRPAPSVLWHQVKRGKLTPRIVSPADVWPLLIDSEAMIDRADQHDYAAHIIDVTAGASSLADHKRRFVALTAAETVLYEGNEISIDKVLGRWPNPFTWPQAEDVPMAGGVSARLRELPLLMLSYWHAATPTELMPRPAASVAKLNHEINVLLSLLFDSIRFQSYSVLALKLSDPSSVAARQRYGARFPLRLGMADDASFLTAGNSYLEQIAVLKDVTRLLAVSERLSPNDVATAGAIPASGWAKLIDSLPKLEARHEHIGRLARHEIELGMPRVVSILTTIGKLDMAARRLQMRVKFADIEVPLTTQERAQRDDWDLAHGMTTEAKLLAKRDGISELEAQEAVTANKSSGQAEAAAHAEDPQRSALDALMRAPLGGAIRKRGGNGAEPAAR